VLGKQLVELPLGFLTPQPLDLQLGDLRRKFGFKLIDAGLGVVFWKCFVDCLG
jgi:hypothetical protein